MENENKYAEVFWTTKDLTETFDIDEKEAEDILSRMSDKLEEVMIERGWNFIHAYIDEYRTQ